MEESTPAKSAENSAKLPSKFWHIVSLLAFAAVAIILDLAAFQTLPAIFTGVVIATGLALWRGETRPLIKRYWPAIAVGLIIVLSMHIRMAGFYNPDGSQRWPYLRNIDSYAFVREIELIVQDGYLKEEPLSYAPDGIVYDTPGRFVYQYLSAYSYILTRMFIPGLPLEQFMAVFPALLASLTAIPFYVIGKALFDRKAGVFGAIFGIFTAPVLSRTLGGDPDSDAITILLAMTAIAAFLAAHKVVDVEKPFAKRTIQYSFLAGIAMALFALTWPGYWFAFMLITGFVVIHAAVMILSHLVHKENMAKAISKVVKPIAASYLLFLAGFWVLTVPYYGPNFIFDPLSQLGFNADFFGSGIKTETGQFPNVYVSVAELQAGGQIRDVVLRSAAVDVAASVSRLPTELLLLLSPFTMTVLALVYLVYSFYKRREHMDTLIFMLIWTFGMIYSSIIATRFTEFLAPVFAICSGIFLSKAWRLVLGEDKTVSK